MPSPGPISLVLGGILLAATVALAQSSAPPRSRAELLRREREAKRARLAPYVPNRVEKQLLRIDKAETPSIADWSFKGFHPRIAWPSRGSGAAPGVRYWEPDLIGPVDLAGAAFYSIRGYQHYDVQFGLLPHVGDRIPQRSWRGDDVYELGSTRPGFVRVPFYVTVRYRYLPEEDYYGSGPDSSLESRTSYLQEETRVYLRTGLQLSKHFAWILSGGYQANAIGSGSSSRFPATDTLFDEEAAPGLSRPPDYLRYGAQLFYDRRDEPGNPHRGGMIAFAYERFDDRTEGAFGFDRFGIDGRAYLPLGSPQRILALRTALLVDEAEPGQRVPFFMQESLGGSHTLRGFDSFRWRGEKVMLYQLEYRWEPLDFWELAVFTDTGTVSEADSELRFANLQWDWGLGTRFKTYRDVVLRFEVAFSRETTRFYIRGSASF